MAEPDHKPPQPTPEHYGEEGYRITPLDPTPHDERFERPVVPEIVVEDDFPLDDGEEKKKDHLRFQFTIRDLFLLTTGVAIWLGIMTTFSFSWSIVAGLMGVAAFVSLIVLTLTEPESQSVRFAWWCILGVYVLTCLCAIVIG